MKKFAGFNPDQQFTLLSKLGYTGSTQKDEMDAFIASSPGIAAKMGRYVDLARKRLEKPKGMAEGGLTTEETLAQSLSDAQAAYADAQTAYVADSSKANKKAADTASNALKRAKTVYDKGASQSTTQTTNAILADPMTNVTQADVATVPTSNDQFIAAGTGQVADGTQVQAQTVDDTQTATATPETEASTVDSVQIADDVKDELADVTAATAEPSAAATVRGQLETLMDDFEGGETPPWASGAMRQAMGIMQSRGLGASSVAGAAVVQAAMESAIGIASQDAQTVASFEMQNLNNEQQTEIFKTQMSIQAMMSDQAQENAALQFNASSENQTKQFFANLETSVSQFNAAQINAIRQFNAGETNAMEKFNEQMDSQRDMFNAQNSLVIAQANTKWRQDIATMDTQTQNAANMATAAQANGMTQAAMDALWQKERDVMNFAFAASQSKKERNLQLTLSGKAAKDKKMEGLGYLLGGLLF